MVQQWDRITIPMHVAFSAVSLLQIRCNLGNGINPSRARKAEKAEKQNFFFRIRKFRPNQRCPKRSAGSASPGKKRDFCRGASKRSPVWSGRVFPGSKILYTEFWAVELYKLYMFQYVETKLKLRKFVSSGTGICTPSPKFSEGDNALVLSDRLEW